jgi:predicted SnoaL-like aldol condensation-catalyzing enzyme
MSVFLFVSCSEKKDPKRELEEKNIALFKEIDAMHMNPDSSGFDAFFDKYVDDAFIDRTPDNDSLPKGKEGFKRELKEFHKAFPNSVSTIEHIAADSDVVMVHTSRTHTMGDGQDAMMLKFKDGKIIEAWSFH